MTTEKEALQEEFNKTEAAIKRYTESIAHLEEEIEQMRDVITKNTVPVHNVGESRIAPST